MATVRRDGSIVASNDAARRLGALFAAHQQAQPAAPAEPGPSVIDVTPETIDGPEKREEGVGGRESAAPAGCADD